MDISKKTFDKTSPLSIYNYSDALVGHTLRDLLGDLAVRAARKGKGGLGQMVEELFFKYSVNTRRDADFAEAEVELKCTPLKKSVKTGELAIKERLICTKINYFEIAETKFEDSHLLRKCSLMLLLFYLHVSGKELYDLEFLFRVLWKLPEKDLIQIKRDYETIAQKVRNGEAHLLSEGDTLYLGAARKGQKGENDQPQPNSPIKAKSRAFSLKPAYMRYILSHVVDSGKNHYTNYVAPPSEALELVDQEQLQTNSFESVILSRFRKHYGLNYIEICSELGIKPYHAKSKYADIAGLIASQGNAKRLGDSDEFLKSGIMMKTIRLKTNGMPKESMSFKNIDYTEVYENDDWENSEAYEIFTNRFLFIVFKPLEDSEIRFYNDKTKEWIKEPAYELDKCFFWTMPKEDLRIAKMYWGHIKEKVTQNKISLSEFWSLKDHRKFHVRPKAAKKSQLTVNPHGGETEKYCYWMNADYIKEIIANQKEN